MRRACSGLSRACAGAPRRWPATFWVFTSKATPTPASGSANGRREASEGGVPGVTLILDRRFVTRTDAQGRYEFPAVAEGEHVIEVSSDNVPLPWTPALRMNSGSI